MSVSVKMPQLGESVTEGTITRWLKNVGDHVTADEPLVEISTDKVDTEIPSPVTGVILSLSAQEDDVVEVGGELALIGEESEVGSPTPVPASTPSVTETAAETTAPKTPEVVSVEIVPEPASPEPAVFEEVAVVQSPGIDTVINLPALGESVTEGTITRWLKAVGDQVAVDEPLVEISTDKVDTEIPAPVAGILISIAAPEDSVVEVGAELGRIGAQVGAQVGAPVHTAPNPPTPAAPAPVATAPVATAPVATAPVAPVSVVPTAASNVPESVVAHDSAGGGYVTPLVRRLAAETGVDLAKVTGTGAGGRITKADVLGAVSNQPSAAAPAAAPAPAPAPAPAAAPQAKASPPRPATPVTGGTMPGTTEPLSRLRKVIAERMVESLQTSAQLTTVVEVDVTRITALRNRVKVSFEQHEGVKLTYMPFFVKAAVEALKQYPQVNASIDMSAGTVTYHNFENIGIAVDTERGLLVPVVHNAGELNIAGISRRIADLADRTRSGKVSPDDLSGGTFTVTNTGSRGALFDTPIVNQPQVAILGTGAVVKRPIVVTDDNGQDVIAIRSMVYLALSYDHRLVDGADAARFLTTMKSRLEDAAFDAELGL
jgi:pyruvate dehydrogenase E2 component (dihydrolipoamide acetyltransferase)